MRGEPSPEAGQPSPATDAGTGQEISFALAVHPHLVSGCQSCHRSGGPAGSTDFLLTGDADGDFLEATSFIDTVNPPLSRLVRKTAGLGHGGGTIYAAGTAEHQALLAWISAGAKP